MWDKLASVFGSGVSEALDSLKKLAIDTWHLDPAKAAELEQKSREIEASILAKQQEELTKLQQMDSADRSSARQREVTLKDYTPTVLAYAITIGFFGVLFYMLNYTIPQETESVLYVMLGSLGTAWTGIIAYYFGSSAGSAAKHNLLDKLTNGKS